MRLPRLVNTNRLLRTAIVTGFAGCLGLAGGCDVSSFIDPGEISNIRHNAGDPLVVQVLDQLDPSLEEGNRQFAAAESPRPEDLVVERTDYPIGPGDLLQITVYDLEGPGLQTIKNTRVSDTGAITLPFLPNPVRVEGLSEIEVQQALIEAYRQAGVLDPAQVSVSVVEQRNRAYNVLGGVARPNVYVITDVDFRLLDALTAAGDVQSPFIEEIFIFRKTDAGPRGRRARDDAAGMNDMTRPATAPAGGRGATTRPVDDLAPQSNSRRSPAGMKRSVLLQEAGAAADPLAPDALEPGTATGTVQVIPENDDPAARVGRVDGQDVLVQPGVEAAEPAGDTGVTADVGMTAAATGTMGGANQPFEFNDLPASEDTRVLRIPLAKLRSGDLRYNIPIRPRDTIFVPPGLVGVYFMQGHVARPGSYRFEGQKITLTQAVTSASGLDGLAIPQRTEIIRRIGPNQEMFYRVDLAAIAAGRRPNIYLQPNDTVSVGTNFLAPFLAAVRGGFRLTYGFGFLYDRNFAYDENNQNR